MSVLGIIFALIASIFVGFEGLNDSTFWFPFLGGLIWSLSGWSAFVGTNRLGTAKAFGIWAPLNLLVGVIIAMVGAVLLGNVKYGTRTRIYVSAC